MKNKIMILFIFYYVIVINEVNTHDCRSSDEHEESESIEDVDYHDDHHHPRRTSPREFAFDHELDNEMFRSDHKKMCQHKQIDRQADNRLSFPMPLDHSAVMSGLFRYPFAVAILKKGVFYTTGVLVDRKWILSSAREFYDKPAKNFRARIGSSNSRRGGVLMEIKKIMIFPLYVFNEPNFDIALLKLVDTVDLTNDVQTISWTDNDLSLYVTIYWPKILIGNKQVSKNAPERINHSHIRATPQSSLFREECNKRLAKDNIAMEPPTICLNPITTLHSPCLADPGAPILSYTGLLGITSGWVSPRCRLHPSESPIIVTRTSSPLIRSWMRDIIEKRRVNKTTKKTQKVKKKVQGARKFTHSPRSLGRQQHKTPQYKKIVNHNIDHKHYDGWM